MFNIKKVTKRVLCLAFCFVIISTQALAVIKEVKVYGAYSINDMGSSDYTISMEDLRSNYAPYDNTDALREYFHVDQPAPLKMDMDEAISWLIDNGVLNRDMTIAVSNIDKVPEVSISKLNLDTVLYKDVTYSDAIMYLYKAVYGVVKGRSIAVETQNIRVDEGERMTLVDIYKKHGSKIVTQGIYSGIFTSVEGGEEGKGGTAGGSGGDGGEGGEAEATITGKKKSWVYTPQGDEWESVFGDTNIFISENYINQETSGGQGGAGGAGGPGINGGNGGAGGGGGGGGAADSIINYETEYKSIEYIPEADLMFYITTDVLELYISEALSRGLLGNTKNLRTEKFNETFPELVKDNAELPSWSGMAQPYIVNQSKSKLIRYNKIKSANTKELLGVNYNIDYAPSSNTMTISRNSFMTQESGYFTTEYFTKMDAFNLIYDFLLNSEKKIPDLERDIVNYKYGMELSGLVNDEDISCIKYLIAKGILNYNGSSDLYNLYTSITWKDYLSFLYRVANKDARLDFSIIQLTDSEKQWQARGFYPQTVEMVPNGAVGTVKVEYDASVFEDVENEFEVDGVEVIPADTVYSGYNKTSIEYGEPRNTVMAPAISSGVDFTRELAKVSYITVDSGTMMFLSYTFNPIGMQYCNSPGGENYLLADFKAQLEELDKCSATEMNAEVFPNYNASNPKHIIMHTMLKNVYVAALLQTHTSLLSSCLTALAEWKLVGEDTMSSTLYAAKLKVAEEFKGALENIRDKSALFNFKFHLKEGQSHKVWNTTCDVYFTSASERFKNFAGKLNYITFSGKYKGDRTAEYYMEFQGGTALNTTQFNSKEQAIDLLKSAPAILEQDIKLDSETNESITSIVENEKAMFERSLSTTVFNDAGEEKGTLKQYIDQEGRDAFIGWQEILDYNKTAGKGKELPIVKISNLILYNTETSTYAYFSDKDKKIALVGTAVVSGDNDLGVVIQAGEGESAQVYYHSSAIRLLIDASVETSVIGNKRTISLPDDTLTKNRTSLKVTGETGIDEGKVNGLRALISRQDNLDSITAKEVYGEDSSYFSLPPELNYRWGDYISLAQSNRFINIISRRIKFTHNNTPMTAFAVVQFLPADVGEMGTSQINSSMSLQDLLDSTAKPPADPEQYKIWASNKDLCNRYANWVYDTTGYTYIETGYFVPKATLYIINNSGAVNVPSNIFKPLTDNEIRAVNLVMLKEVPSGATQALGGNANTAESREVTWDTNTWSAYYLSEDFDVIVSGDRVYMNSKLFDNLVLSTDIKGELSYFIKSHVSKPSTFTLGSRLKVKGVGETINGYTTPDIQVMETSDDGTITCWVGPIKGTPVKNSGKAYLIDNEKVNKVIPMSNYYLNNTPEADAINNVISKLFQNLPMVKYNGILDNTEVVVTTGDKPNYIFDGNDIHVFVESDRKAVGKVALRGDWSTLTFQEIRDNLRELVALYSSEEIDTVHTYVKVSFPAQMHTLVNGELVQAPSMVSDYISPTMFTCLNDMIISGIINDSNGAIPVNDIPEGSLLKLGNMYYVAQGTSTDAKKFTGYSYLGTGSVGMEPQIPDLVKRTMSTHFIMAGNQYINISHYFKDFKILDKLDDKSTKALSLVVKETLSSDKYHKISVTLSGKLKDIFDGDKTLGSYMYSPTAITFSEGLMAYQITAPTDAVPVFNVVNTSALAISGALDKLPFYTNGVFNTELYDLDNDMLGVSFKFNSGADKLVKLIKDEFREAFAGDILTLARLILFVLIIWLVVASWICYVFRLANLGMFFDIRSGEKDNGTVLGRTLVKIFTLNTIDLGMEFRLGKFLQYNVVMAALLCVVWFSGRITIF